MPAPCVHLSTDGAVAEIVLDDPDRRTALGTAMFDGLFEAIDTVGRDDRLQVALLRGKGKAFCSGFDVTAAAQEPDLLGDFVGRLGDLLKTLRRMPQVVIAAVQGAAIAGGCAIVSASDVVVVSRGAKLGYPVHRLGLSPAVTTSTLMQKVGPGHARHILMGGRLIDGATAHAWGMAHHLSDNDAAVLNDARVLARAIAAHGPNALRATKHWLNELDGSLEADRTDRPAQHSAETADEARTLLPAFLAEATKRRSDGATKG